MVTVDIAEIQIRCRNCGFVHQLDLFEIPMEIECCDEPDITLEEDIELEIR